MPRIDRPVGGIKNWRTKIRGFRPTPIFNKSCDSKTFHEYELVKKYIKDLANPVSMIHTLRKIMRNYVKNLGYSITPIYDPIIDEDKQFTRIYNQCKKYTMTSKERMYALYKSVEYIVQSKIPGDFVECGVWRGGSAMLIGHTLVALGERNRRIYLYDTFEGMIRPTEQDFSTDDPNAMAIHTWVQGQRSNHNNWCFASLSDVKRNMSLTNYPDDRIFFIKGKVEETIPKTIPSKISLLRLDTDWYESTKHELIHLFPLLSKNGVIIIDDYGEWRGSKKAVDEYFAHVNILLNRVDLPGRIGIKSYHS